MIAINDLADRWALVQAVGVFTALFRLLAVLFR